MTIYQQKECKYVLNLNFSVQVGFFSGEKLTF